MAIRYHFDLYPRSDPKNGARLVRFTKLQSAEYRGEANGTGAGQLSIRADTSEAQFIDPDGLQYVRVVREDTVAVTEVVVGGFFLDSGDFTALDERGTRLLKFGGAGTLSYLSRAIMASHTYLDIAIGQDPYDDTWRLYEQGPIAGGDMLGAVLWRVVYEAQRARVALTQHRHVDDVIYTDSHADDRTATALPALTLGFTGSVDSNGAAWAVSSGEFKAQVGENVLAVVKRLMEAGLYVSMDPDTFELDAYPSATHRRTRTGAAWGANVIRFQAPTGGDISTGNIKSDATRAIAAFVKRSWLLAGGQDTYGDATGTTDIPWEGFYTSDTEVVAALNQIAGVQIGARDDAGDTLRLRIRLGTIPATGYYLPFEHILLDDLVTVHTGTGQWDYNEQTFPVAAMTVALRIGGDWDCWVELGSSYGAASSRQFQVSPVAAHNHGPNPQLCQPGSISAVSLVGTNASIATATTDLPLTVGAESNKALYLGVLVRESSVGTKSAAWHPAYFNSGTPGAGEAMTRIAQLAHPSVATLSIEIWRLVNPPASTTGTSAVRWTTTGTVEAGIAGYWFLSGVDQTTPENATATNSGITASASTVTVASPELVLDVAGWMEDNAIITAPAVSGGQAQDWSLTKDSTFGVGDVGAGGAHGAGATPTWNFTNTYDYWLAAAVSVAGSGVTSVGDGHPDLVGTARRAARCDHRHDVHRDRDPSASDSWTDAGYKLGTRWARLDSLTTPTAIVGEWVLVKDTGLANGATWVETVVGVTDHGALTGLADDDHTQYLTSARHDVLAHDLDDLTTRWEPIGFPDGTILVLDDGEPVMAEVSI